MVALKFKVSKSLLVTRQRNKVAFKFLLPVKLPNKKSNCFFTYFYPFRVLHIGECGLHIHKPNCEDTSLIKNVNTLIKSADILFPKSLKIKTLSSERSGTVKPSDAIFGGWSDRRDHELCMNFTI